MGVWTSQTKAMSGDKRLGLGRASIFALRIDWHESGLLSHALEQERRVFNTAVLMQLRHDDRQVKWRQWHCTVEEMRIGRGRGSIYALRMEEHDWWLLSQALDREILFFCQNLLAAAPRLCTISMMPVAVYSWRQEAWSWQRLNICLENGETCVRTLVSSSK